MTSKCVTTDANLYLNKLRQALSPENNFRRFIGKGLEGVIIDPSSSKAYERRSVVDLIDWLQSLAANYGYGAVFLALFLNNLGVPAPGTTMLLVAGFLAGKGILSLWATVAIGTAACFLGSNCGYWLGQQYGLRLLGKIHWLRLTHRRVKHLERFFKRYGPKGVFFARFVSLLHPLIGLMAGVGKTPKGPFLFYNLAGSAVYGLLYTLAGDFFGSRWGLHNIWRLHISSYALLLMIVLVILSLFWRYSIHSFFGYVYFKKR
jgi:membrane protein DedA with SNARE-associated domain